MKKTALILTLAFLTIASSAQSLLPVKYGIKVGANISNITKAESIIETKYQMANKPICQNLNRVFSDSKVIFVQFPWHSNQGKLCQLPGEFPLQSMHWQG